jgi:peptidyl-prolyl cis-trans isomerase SurA
MKYSIFLILVIFSACSILDRSKSSGSSSLFTVAEDTVAVEEFIYAFEKNRPADSIVQKSEVDEYLDLYKKFKLKVAEAKALGMDTTPSFRQEYSTYIGQLDNSYLQSTNDTDSLVYQAFNRLQSQVNASHILLMVEESAPPEDTLAIFNKIITIRDSLVNHGADFGQMAAKYSEDPSARQNKGELGFFSVFQMVYPFENAAFTTNVGEISQPVRTRFGYHLVKVNDKRSNDGKIRVAHIMIRTSATARDKAFELFEQLMTGADWQEICAANSQDFQSASRGGELAPFGRGQIVKEFSDAAFALNTPGEISQPVQTPFGWHIIRLIEKIPVDNFDKMEEQLEAQVRRGDRSKVSEQKMLARIASANNFVEQSENIQQVIEPQNHQYAKVKFVFENDSLAQLVLFSINNEPYTADSLYQFIKKSASQQNTRPYLYEKYIEFKNEALLNYEKAHLAEKYPEYRYLRNEYYEGILLFSIMEEHIWNPASTDSVGIANYYQEHKDEFIDSTTVELAIFSSLRKGLMDSLMARFPDKESFLVLTKSEKEALLSQNNDSAKVSLQLEFGEFALADDLLGSLGGAPVQPVIKKVDERWYYLLPVRKPGEARRLPNIKGRLIAAYQEALEAEWLTELKEKYDVVVDDKALKFVYNKLDTK